MNTTYPLITIIVPAYNSQDYLPICLNSLLGQTYDNIEILVINDGSTDSTASVCNKYLENNSNITVLTQKNGGVSSARNLGIKSAAGDYVAFVDSDDELMPDAILEAYKTAINSSSEIVGYNSLIIDYRGNKTHMVKKHIKQTQLSNGEIIQSFLTDDIIGESTCNKLFSKKIINDLYFNDDIKINEDKLYLFMAIKKCESYTYLNSPNYIIHKRRDSASNSSFNQNFYGIKQVADIIFDEIKLRYPELINIAEQEKIKAYIQLYKYMTTSKNEGRKNINYEQLRSQIRKQKYRSLGSNVYSTQFLIIKYCHPLYYLMTDIYINLKRIKVRIWAVLT